MRAASPGVTEGGREERAEHGLFRAAKRSVGRASGGRAITTCQVPAHAAESEPERKQQAVAERGSGLRRAPAHTACSPGLTVNLKPL